MPRGFVAYRLSSQGTTLTLILRVLIIYIILIILTVYSTLALVKLRKRRKCQVKAAVVEGLRGAPQWVLLPDWKEG
jgi:hypothetical protein